MAIPDGTGGCGENRLPVIGDVGTLRGCREATGLRGPAMDCWSIERLRKREGIPPPTGGWRGLEIGGESGAVGGR